VLLVLQSSPNQLSVLLVLRCSHQHVLLLLLLVRPLSLSLLLQPPQPSR
jgi:hypothetical protein